MRSDITRLTTLIKVDKSTQSIGEFEKHSKAFGSGYMEKYGFMKGKGLGKNKQGRQEPIPFIKNWCPLGQRLMVSNLRVAHLKSK
jgi:hypothetical protein